MKAILISIRPKWTAKILNGEKTIEVRKTAPKRELPCEVYIYCTKDRKEALIQSFFDRKKPCRTIEKDDVYVDGYERNLNGKVVAKFTLNKIHNIYNGWTYKTCSVEYGTTEFSDKEFVEKSCISKLKLDDYLKKKKGYAWEISNLVIFDKPKELKEFDKNGSYRSVKNCPKKNRGECNEGISPFTGKWCGCDKARLTHAPQSWCYCEVEE